MHMGTGFAFLLAALAGDLGAGAGGPSPRLTAVRTSQPPVLDGTLDDAAWMTAPLADRFTQKFPDDGGPSSEYTSVRVLYDDEALYVGVRCDQRDSVLVRQLTRRDREVEADRVSITVSSRRDGHSGYRFDVTADGVLADGAYYDDDEFAREWDGNWEAATSINDQGWSVELRIPLRILRFDARPVQDWGFNVQRYITARQEVAEWAYVPRTDAGVVSRLGRMDNLQGLSPGGGLELRPFVLGRTTHRDVRLGPGQGFAHDLSVGLDAKWRLTPDLALNAAFNPDFGQVEVDEVVLNLSTYEVEYAEKRPFFLDGADVFTTPVLVLYTRRIGRVPPSPPHLPGESPAPGIAPSPIWGALKLIGRLGPRLSIGALAALTGPNQVQVAGPDGAVRIATADPAALYAILRLKGDFGSRGHVGLIATRANPLARPALAPLDPVSGRVRCPGGLTTVAGGRCFGDATVLGLDGRWRSGGGHYAASGQALLSQVAGPARPQRDGTVIDPGALGVLATANLAKVGGHHWLWQIDGDFIGRKVDITDLGYLERQNRLSLEAGLTFRTSRPWWRTIETETELGVRQATTLDGLPLGRAIALDSEWTLPGFWEMGLNAEYVPSHFDDREVGDGTALERPGYGEIGFEFESDPRAPVDVEVEASTLFFVGGGRGYELEGGVSMRLVPQLDLDLEVELTSRTGEPRFVDRTLLAAEGTRTVFANLRAMALGPLMRMTWTFTPRLTVQAFAQLFLASRQYDDYRVHDTHMPRPRVRLRDLTPITAPSDDERPDEVEAAFNVNLLLRWEYRLGSAIHLVYTRAQAPEDLVSGGGLRSLDFGRLRRAAATQTLMLKLAHWWG